MLQAFHDRVLALTYANRGGSAEALQQQYTSICNILKSHLTEEEFKMVQQIELVDFSTIYNSNGPTYQKVMDNLVVASEVTIAYLKSLDMNFDRELAKEKIEIKLLKNRLEADKKEVDSLKKILKDSAEAMKVMPELFRSKIVEETKKSHREIEKNTNPNTKSQQKNKSSYALS